VTIRLALGGGTKRKSPSPDDEKEKDIRNSGLWKGLTAAGTTEKGKRKNLQELSPARGLTTKEEGLPDVKKDLEDQKVYFAPQ